MIHDRSMFGYLGSIYLTNDLLPLRRVLVDLIDRLSVAFSAVLQASSAN